MDILAYEIGYIGQYKDEETGELVAKSFDEVASALDHKIEEICAAVWATEEPLLFITGNKILYNKEERAKEKKRKRVEKKLEKNPEDTEAKELLEQLSPKEYKPNFRDKVAKKKKYKGNRKTDKPIHWLNIIEYAKAQYDVVEAQGLEADDLLCIEQLKSEPLTTIICSRDKDLRICPGMHYGWECGRQREYGPRQVTELGELSLTRSKLTGSGLMFFYSQIITGDTTDNIPGLPKGGPAMAHRILWECETEEEMFNAVAAEYERVYGDDWRDEMLEQGRLLWMCRELDENEEAIQWVLPY